MKMPQIDLTVEWRLLVNYRVDAQVAARWSYFEDPSSFPAGSGTLDCAVLMRDVPVTWHALDPVRSAQPAASTAT